MLQPRLGKAGHPIFCPTISAGALNHTVLGQNWMYQSNPSKARILPLRRLALLATTVAGLAVGGILVAPTLSPYAPSQYASNLSQEAQQVARPVGFDDIVEKVKPAVISVRVKMRTDAQSS